VPGTQLEPPLDPPDATGPPPLPVQSVPPLSGGITEQSPVVASQQVPFVHTSPVAHMPASHVQPRYPSTQKLEPVPLALPPLALSPPPPALPDAPVPFVEWEPLEQAQDNATETARSLDVHMNGDPFDHKRSQSARNAFAVECLPLVGAREIFLE
jgi:hypothetical protein